MEQIILSIKERTVLKGVCLPHYVWTGQKVFVIDARIASCTLMVNVHFDLAKVNSPGV